MANIEELQKLLEDQIAKLGEERQANALQFTKEREEATRIANTERAKQADEYNAKIAAREAEKKRRDAEELEKQRQDRATRLANEQKQYELDEALRKQREKLEWLTNEISKAEFTEEQFKKSMESQRSAIIITSPTVENINVEYPEAPSNGGEAVAGTTGDTPDTPLMSQHLRHILRQAERQ